MCPHICIQTDTLLILREMKELFFLRGIDTSKTTSYNPRGNEQVERYNGIILAVSIVSFEFMAFTYRFMGKCSSRCTSINLISDMHISTNCKYKIIVCEVDLIETNSQYAHVHLPYNVKL